VLMPLSEFRQWLSALYALTATFGRVVAIVEPSGPHCPHSSLWEVGKTTHERRSDAYEVNGLGKLRPELLTPWAAIRIRLQNRKPGKGSISLTSAFGFERNITATDLSDLSI
jgi:hypothetical protein